MSDCVREEKDGMMMDRDQALHAITCKLEDYGFTVGPMKKKGIRYVRRRKESPIVFKIHAGEDEVYATFTKKTWNAWLETVLEDPDEFSSAMRVMESLEKIGLFRDTVGK